MSIWDRVANELDPDSGYPTPGALACAIDSSEVDHPWLKIVDEHLVALADREIPGLILSAPPRHGKTRRVSQKFPVWYLRKYPKHRIINSSYGADLAVRSGSAVRNLIDANPQLGMQLGKGSKRVDDWSLTTGGGMLSVGVGGGITGKGANLRIVDDPHKNIEEAHSQVMREKVWDWWTTDFGTRLEHDGRLGPVSCVIATRWHDDDLIGRILNSGEAKHWAVVNLPALADVGDPLGREPGQALCPERVPLEFLLDRRQRMGSYGFEALYQGRPTPQDGGFFQRQHFNYWTKVDADEGALWLVRGKHIRPHHCWTFATVDLAATTKTSSDWTVVAVWAVTPDNDLLLVDMYRGRITPREHWGHVKHLAEKHQCRFVGVEAAMHQTTLVYEAAKAGVVIRELRADTDKFTRAIPAQARFEAGMVWLPKHAPWLDTYEAELLSFPAGAHDDMVDVTAYAAHQLAISPQRPPQERPEDEWGSIAWIHDRVIKKAKSKQRMIS